MTSQEINEVIRRAYRELGAAGLQLVFPFMTINAIKKRAKALGVTDPENTGRPRRFGPCDPLNEAFRMWGGVVEEGPLSWRV